MHRRASSFLFDKSRKGDGYLLEDAYHCAPSKGEIPKLVPRNTNRMNVTPWREQQKKFLLRCSKRKCVRCTNLISFPDVITLLFHEIDASYHGCSNRDKRYLNHAITKGTAWWVSDGQVYKLLATYQDVLSSSQGGKQVNQAIYLTFFFKRSQQDEIGFGHV
jgi:hypothetical protein